MGAAYKSFYVYAPIKRSKVDSLDIDDQFHVDREGLSNIIQEYCNMMDSEGYEVFSIFPTISGIPNTFEDDDLKFDHGFSVTDGAIITGRRKRS